MPALIWNFYTAPAEAVAVCVFKRRRVVEKEDGQYKQLLVVYTAKISSLERSFNLLKKKPQFGRGKINTPVTAAEIKIISRNSRHTIFFNRLALKMRILYLLTFGVYREFVHQTILAVEPLDLAFSH